MKNLSLGLAIGILAGVFGTFFYPSIHVLFVKESEEELIQRIRAYEQSDNNTQIAISSNLLSTAMNLAKRQDANLQKIIDEKRFRSYLEVKYSDLLKEIDAENNQLRVQMFKDFTKLELLEYEKYIKLPVLAKIKENSMQMATQQREFFDKRRSELKDIVEKEAREIGNSAGQK